MSGRVSKKKRIVLVAIIVIALVLVALGVGGWTYHAQPRFCSDLCHIMNPYLESWNGYGSFTTDRIGRGTVHVDGLCLSIFGGIQMKKYGEQLQSINVKPKSSRTAIKQFYKSLL